MTALREHWDEANARVLQRKAQLDAMLGDSQRYEARRRDSDAWLSRMEARLAAMAPPGHTADVLEMQLREQKVNMASDYLFINRKSSVDCRLKKKLSKLADSQETLPESIFRLNNIDLSIDLSIKYMLDRISEGIDGSI